MAQDSTHIKMKNIVFTSLIIISMASYANEIAQTEDGRQVRLNKNGTYTYLKNNDQDYERIDFIRLHLDARELEGQKVTLKGYARFDPLSSENKAPMGGIAEKPNEQFNTYMVSTKSLDRSELSKVGRCSSECLVELSGVVYQPYARREDLYYIDARHIKIIKGPSR